MPGPVVARGSKVLLRIARPEDASFLQRSGCEPPLRYPLGSRILSRETIKEQIESRNDDRFLICPLQEDSDDDGMSQEGPVGAVNVEDADWKRPELTYWAAPEAQGKGYGGEGVALAVDFAFRNYDAPTVEAGAFPFNDASRGLLESLGFDQEGIHRNNMFVDGQWRDYVVYALDRADWEPLTERR